MNIKLEFLAITCNLSIAREKSHVCARRDRFWFSFSLVEKLGRVSKCSIRNREIKSHLNTVLIGISCKPLNSFFNTDLYLKTQKVRKFMPLVLGKRSLAGEEKVVDLSDDEEVPFDVLAETVTNPRKLKRVKERKSTGRKFKPFP